MPKKKTRKPSSKKYHNSMSDHLEDMSAMYGYRNGEFEFAYKQLEYLKSKTKENSSAAKKLAKLERLLGDAVSKVDIASGLACDVERLLECEG